MSVLHHLRDSESLESLAAVRAFYPVRQVHLHEKNTLTSGTFPGCLHGTIRSVSEVHSKWSAVCKPCEVHCIKMLVWAAAVGCMTRTMG